jgi:ribosomal protein S27AE
MKVEINVSAICPKCGFIMARDKEARVACRNSSCSYYNILFEPPSMEIQPAKQIKRPTLLKRLKAWISDLR